MSDHVDKGLFRSLRYKPHSDKWSRLMPIGVFCVALVLAVYEIWQLYVTTVLNYDQYAKAASSQQWRLVTSSSDRGQIYDANGIALASNSYDYTVVCTPRMVVSKTLDREAIIKGFISILGVTYEKMDSILPVDPKDGSDPRVKIGGCDVCKNVPADKRDELEKFLKDNNAHKGYDPQIQEEMNKTEQDGYLSIDGNGGGFTNDRDEYFADAARLVIEKEKGSIGMLQRNFKIGFNRAARIMDQLEDFGVVGPEEGTKPRRILLTIEEFERLLSEEGV